MTKKILYIDMDNVLVDFKARLDGITASIQDKYRSRGMDEIPGIFALMPPMAGAIEAFEELSGLFDTYLLSTAPWHNPSAWQHKVEWVHLHLGDEQGAAVHKRLILSHHKNLNRGDFLIDDRPNNGAREFGEIEGQTWLRFGSDEFPDWPSIVAHLRPLS